jgi:uncharacterized protein involved in response to NO
MTYALFPFFMFGFLMTTYPRWMNGPEVPRPHYIAAFVPLAAGVLAVYATPWFGRPVLIAGALLGAVGFATGSLALWRVYRAAPATDKHYERHLNSALACALAGQAAFLAWLLGAGSHWLALATTAGFWLFLVPVLVIVGHRMIPFFSVNALADYRLVQPRWSLPLMWVGVLGHAACDLLGLGAWRLLPDALLLGVALQLTLAWKLPASLSVKLLAVLHIAFAGLSFGMALFVAQDLALLAGYAAWLGRAPQHALAIGFVTAMALGMVTRVTLGHSGRALEMDGYAWTCFLGIEAALLLRVAAEMPWPTAWFSGALSLAAALAWLLAVGAWVARFAPYYLQRRVDGNPG